MINCMKKYKMVLSSTDGEIVYKSDSVYIDESEAYDFERNGRVTAEIRMTAREVEIETAEKPPEMPLAATAAQATKIIQEKKRKAAIEKEWSRLTDEICKAVKAGDEKIYSKVVFGENKERLEKMGYHLVMTNMGTFEYRIAWAGIYMD